MNDILKLLTSPNFAEVAEGVLMAEVLLTDQDAATADRNAIREALIAIVEAEPPHPSAGAAVWALGKLRDESLRPIFIRFMRRAVQKVESSGGDLFQAIIALADTGERSLQISRSVNDLDLNFSLANKFLHRIDE